MLLFVLPTQPRPWWETFVTSPIYLLCRHSCLLCRRRRRWKWRRRWRQRRWRRGTRKRIRIRLRRQPDRRLSQRQHRQLQARCATRFQHRTTPDSTQSPTTGQRRYHRLAQRGSRRPPRRCRYRRQRRGRRQQPRCELLREREMRRERREREDDHGGGRRPRGTTRPHQSQRDPDAGMGKRRLRQSGVGGDARPHRHPARRSERRSRSRCDEGEEKAIKVSEPRSEE